MNESLNNRFNMKYQRILLAVLVTAVYGVSLFNGFVWDDKIFFVGNPAYKGFNPRAIFCSLANGVEYLPLRDITYALDYLVWGESPSGFHFTNLFLFTAIILLVHQFTVIIIRRFSELTGRNSSSFLPLAVAAGFAIHPVNAEVVNFITCRNVLVSAVFVFLSSICMFRYLDDKSLKMLSAAFAAFVLAMLGKATAIMLPLLFLTIFPILFPGQLKRIIAALLPFFAASCGFFIFFKRVADNAGITNIQPISSAFSQKMAVALQIPFFYLRKLILPYGFSAEYATDFSPLLLSIKVAAASLAIIAAAAALACMKRSYPQLTAGGVWFIVALFPVLNFFDTHPLVADRYLFLPAFGFMLATVSAVDMIRGEKVKQLICFIIGLFLSVMAVSRSLDWRSEETLWMANIKSAPGEAKAYINLAAFYFKNRQEQKAIDLLSANLSLQSIGVYRDYLEGRRLFNQGELAGAKRNFLAALEGNNGFVSALRFLGEIAEKEQDYSSALQYYSRALNSFENDSLFDHPFIKGRLQVLKNGLADDQYLAGLKQRVVKNPADLAAHKELALTFDQRGYYEEALEHYLALERGGVKGWQICHNIANCYLNMNRNGEAVGYYEKAVALGSVSEDTFNNLGIAYRKLSKYKSSIEVLQAAVRKFPNASYPVFNLGIAYYEAGEKEKARSSFLEVERRFPEYKSRTAPYLQKLSNSNK